MATQTGLYTIDPRLAKNAPNGINGDAILLYVQNTDPWNYWRLLKQGNHAWTCFSTSDKDIGKWRQIY